MSFTSGLGSLFSGIGSLFGGGGIDLPKNVSVDTPMYQGTNSNGVSAWSSDPASLTNIRNTAMDLNGNGRVDIAGMDIKGIQDYNDFKTANSGLGGSILGKAWDGVGGLSGLANMFGMYQSYKNDKFNQKMAKHQQALLDEKWNMYKDDKANQKLKNDLVISDYHTKKRPGSNEPDSAYTVSNSSNIYV